MSKEQFILKQTIGAKVRRFFFGLSTKEYIQIMEAANDYEREVEKRLQNRVYKGEVFTRSARTMK